MRGRVSFFLRLLFDTEGFVIGRAYLYAGALLFAIKYLLDLVIVHSFFDRPWMPWDYLNIQWRDIDFLDLKVVRFATFMLALALPFIWCGVVLTLKRLRSLGWPGALVCLFFVPYLNIPFFFVLAFWPDKFRAPSLIVERRFAGAVLVVFLMTAFALSLVAAGVELLQHYGWGLFVGIPFFIGFVPGLLHKTISRRPILECIFVGLATQTFLAAALLVFALEGLICLLMAAPLAISLTCFGAFIGYTVRRIAGWEQTKGEIFCFSAVLLLPLIMLAEKSVAPSPGLIPVQTEIDVAAPPAVVWKHVVSFSELPPPTEWIFHAGVAHPLRAEIQGTGPGAIRHCVFSTGPFVEPIEIWDEPRLLRFSVTTNPPPMQELSFRQVDPPHLNGFLQSERGQFLLSEIAPGQTRLQGTTWYRHGLWPEAYWKLWSDYIIHTIHLRVLRHIKSEAEHESQTLR